jgi:hypothetical protein
MNFKYWGFGHRRYWLINVWLKSESPSIDFLGLVALSFETLQFATWGAFVLMIVHMPTHNSNVISPMSSTIILGVGPFVCLKCLLLSIVHLTLK